MGKHYSTEFKQKIIDEYKSGKSGGYKRVGRTKEENIDYKERYEILKKYQAFLKA